MRHLFLFPTTYTGFLPFCFVTSEKWLYWPFMQGWRGLEASRVKRYRLGKDRKIGSFGLWIPIYQHPPFSLLILNHFLLILVLLPVILDSSGQLVFQAIGELLRQGIGPWPPLYTYSWEHEHSTNVYAHTRSPEAFEPEMPVFETECSSYSAYTMSNSAIAIVQGVI